MADLEQALALKADGDGWRAAIPGGWGQGRTTFGGLVAAYLTRAAQAANPRSVRSVDVYFLEPVAPGPVFLAVESARDGKHLTHLEMSLQQADRRAATARFVLAETSVGAFDATPPAPVPETTFDDAVQMPYLEAITPEFTRNMDIKYGEGDYPFTGSQRAVGGGFIRNNGPARGIAALLTHCDSWPPPVLALVDRPVAASSVRWHVQFHADVDSADGQQWSWYRHESLWRSGPLSTVVGTLVRDGIPVAYSEQTVAMYA